MPAPGGDVSVHPGADELKQLVSALSTPIRARLAGWYGSGASLSGDPSVHVRPWSVFVRFPIAVAGPGPSPTLLVKFRRHPDFDLGRMLADADLRAQGRDEFETLQRLERLTAGSDAHCAVRAVDYFDEWSALVMEELRARSVKARLERGGAAASKREQRRLETVFERAGGLLRLFHEGVSTPTDGPIVDDDVRRNVSADLDRLEQRWPGGPEVDALRGLLARVDDLGQRLTVRHTRLHRDFNCSNILVADDGRVGLLDPRMLPGAVYRDLARVTVDLETFSLQGLTHGLFLRRAAAAFGGAVLRGYFQASEPNRVALEFFRLVAVLDKWRYDDERAARDAQRGIRRFVDGSAVAWRRRLLATLLERQRRRLATALEPLGG